MIELCQAYVTAEQRAAIQPPARPYQAPASRDAREYALFKRRFAEPRNGITAWGVVSVKFELKTRVTVQAFHDFAANQIDAGYNCVFINPMIGTEAFYLNVWEQWLSQPAKDNQDIIAAAEQIGGFDMRQPMAADTMAFCNYFVATERFWIRYFEYVDRIIDALPPTLRTRPSGYPRNPDLPEEVFLIERLFSPFVQANRDLGTIAMRPTREDYRARFGHLLGDGLAQLSAVKQAACAGDAAAMQVWQGLRQQLGFMLPTVGFIDDPSDPLLSLARSLAEPAALPFKGGNAMGTTHPPRGSGP